MKKHNFDFSVCRERICTEVAHFHWSGNRMALIRLHRADTHEWESKKHRPSCFTCWVLTPNVRTTKLLCALPQRSLITLCSSVVSVYTHTLVCKQFFYFAHHPFFEVAMLWWADTVLLSTVSQCLGKRRRWEDVWLHLFPLWLYQPTRQMEGTRMKKIIEVKFLQGI